MKKSLLLFASLISLALAVPFGTYAEDSVSSSGSTALPAPHEPTEDHTTGSAESTELLQATGSTTSTGSATSTGSTNSLETFMAWIWQKVHAGEIPKSSVEKYRPFLKKLRSFVYQQISWDGYAAEERDEKFKEVLRNLISAFDKAIASKKYDEEKTGILMILRKWSFDLIQSGQTGSDWFAQENSISVVCTELHRQGLMSDAWYAADSEYGRTRIDDETMAGYHSWGIPLAKAMRESTILTAVVKPFGLAWAQHMAYRMGATKDDSKLGATMQAVGVPVNRFIGQVNGLLDEVSSTDEAAEVSASDPR